MPATNAFWDCNRQKQTEHTFFFGSFPPRLFGLTFDSSENHSHLCVVARSVTVVTVDDSLFYMGSYI